MDIRLPAWRFNEGEAMPEWLVQILVQAAAQVLEKLLAPHIPPPPDAPAPKAP